MADPVPAALTKVEAFCERRIPQDLRHQVRLEAGVRGNSITIVELRAPWNPDFGSEWTRSEVARLRFDSSSGTWALQWRRADGSWRRYEGLSSARDVTPLLAEIDADPSGVFWG